MNYIRRCRRQRLLALIILLASGFIYLQQQGSFGTAASVLQAAQPGLYTVQSFVDGDTIAVSMNGQVEKIRFIGVDTPETHKPNTPVQCYGPAAASFTKNTIGQRPIRLVSDSLSTDRDRYNRLLRYVYLTDGTLVNEQLILNGYGFYYPYFPFTKSPQFALAQARAQSNRAGLWAQCQPTPTDQGGFVSNTQ